MCSSDPTDVKIVRAVCSLTIQTKTDLLLSRVGKMPGEVNDSICGIVPLPRSLALTPIREGHVLGGQDVWLTGSVLAPVLCQDVLIRLDKPPGWIRQETKQAFRNCWVLRHHLDCLGRQMQQSVFDCGRIMSILASPIHFPIGSITAEEVVSSAVEWQGVFRLVKQIIDAATYKHVNIERNNSCGGRVEEVKF